MVELAAILAVVLRVLGVKGAFFQAFAHIVVGGLFGAWFANRSTRYYLYLALALSLVELVAFAVSRGLT